MTPPVATDSRDQRLARYQRFVEHVQKVCAEDPGRRAALRRSLGRLPEDAGYRAHGVVARFLSETPNRAEERAFYAVAAMIAAQPRDARDQERSNNGQGDTASAEPDATSAGDALDRSRAPVRRRRRP